MFPTPFVSSPTETLFLWWRGLHKHNDAGTVRKASCRVWKMALELHTYQALTNSDAMRRLNGIVDRVSVSDVTVLICGESGVGKEIVARALHERSRRRDGPFVKVNCAALPLELLESELFGYERGAFTGANHPKPGKFELAETGTIFLDEIGEMPVTLQAKLLQVLQDREFCRLGSRHDVRVDVRVLAASSRDLAREVKRGAFREDLFYRLNVVSLRVPPLRDRREEIPVLVEHFLEHYSQEDGCPPLSVSETTLRCLMRYDWPGNVRELEKTSSSVSSFWAAKRLFDELQELAIRGPRCSSVGRAGDRGPARGRPVGGAGFRRARPQGGWFARWPRMLSAAC
jgi:transcriptional regulator with GAF, ATPase, and Fis domain